MKTPAFDHCLRILENWDKPDSDVRDELLFDSKNFPDEIILPFRREINKLLANKRKSKVRISHIRNYIDELNRTTNIIERYLSLKIISFYDENKKVILRFTDDPGTETKFRIFEMVCVLYTTIFDEIQLSCKTFDIPFLEICKEVNFPLNTINIKIPSGQLKTKSPKSETSIKLSDTPEIKPIFELEYIDQIFDLLKEFFPKDQQPQLLTILENGKDVTTPLLFQDSGSRLADMFKQFYNAGIIKSGNKKNLEKWMGHNFKFLFRGKSMDFTPNYLNHTISSSSAVIKCKRPIITVLPDPVTGKHLIVKA